MFNKLNFIVPLNNNDTILKIRNTNGLVVNIIREPTCTLKVTGVNLTIKQNSESNAITLKFSTATEAKEAHILLRNALQTLATNIGINLGGHNPGPEDSGNNPEINNTCQCEDCDPKRNVVLLTDIWTQSDEIPNTAPLAASSVVLKVVDLELEFITGTLKFDSVNFTDIIPPYFGDGTSYAFILKTFDNVIIPNDWQGWKVDLDCGIVSFKEGFVSTGPIIVDATHPPKITFFKYTGNKGIFDSINNFSVSFHPPQTVLGVEQNMSIPAGIQNINGLFLNGQLIDNNIIPHYLLYPSATSPTIIAWLDTAEYELEPDDVMTIQYFNIT